MSRRIVKTLGPNNNVLLKQLYNSNISGRGSSGSNINLTVNEDDINEHFERFRHELYVHKSINPLKSPTMRKNFYQKSIYMPSLIDKEKNKGEIISMFLSNHEYCELIESENSKSFNLKLAFKLLYYDVFEQSNRSRIQMYHYKGEHKVGSDNEIYTSSNKELLSFLPKDQAMHFLKDPNERIKSTGETKSILSTLKVMLFNKVYSIKPETSYLLLETLNNIAKNRSKHVEIERSSTDVLAEGIQKKNKKSITDKNFDSEKFKIVEKENAIFYSFEKDIEYPISMLKKSPFATKIPINDGEFNASIACIDEIFNIQGFAYTSKHKNFLKLKKLDKIPHPLSENKDVKLYHIENLKPFLPFHRDSNDEINEVDNLISLIPCVFNADAEVVTDRKHHTDEFLFNIRGEINQEQRKNLPEDYKNLSNRQAILSKIAKDLKFDESFEIPKWSFLKKSKRFFINNSMNKNNTLCLTEYSNGREVLKGNIINVLLYNQHFRKVLCVSRPEGFILEDESEGCLVDLLDENNIENKMKIKKNIINVLPKLLDENLEEFDDNYNLYDLTMCGKNSDILRNTMLKVNTKNEVILDDIKYRESQIEYNNHVTFMEWFRIFFGAESKKLKIDLIATLSRTSQFFEPWDYYMGHKFHRLIDEFEKNMNNKELYKLNTMVENFLDEFYNRYLPLVIKELNIIKYKNGKDDRQRYKRLYLLLGNYIYHFNKEFLRYKFPKLTKYYYDLSNFKVAKKFTESRTDRLNYEVGEFYLFLNNLLKNVGNDVNNELIDDYKMNNGKCSSNQIISNDKINQIMEKIELKQIAVAQMNQMDKSKKPYSSTVFFKNDRFRTYEEQKKLDKMKKRDKRKENENDNVFKNVLLNTEFVRNSIMKNLRIQNQMNTKMGFSYFNDCAIMVCLDFPNLSNKSLASKIYGNLKYYQEILKIQQPIPVYYMKPSLMHIPHGFDLIKKSTHEFYNRNSLESVVTVFVIKRKDNRKYIELVKRM